MQTYALLIKNLVLSMQIGCHNYEKTITQRVKINAKITVLKTDTIVSYKDIVDVIQDIAQQQHYEYLETLGDKIIQACFQEPNITEIELELLKPDVIENAEAVGILIKENRNDS